MNPPSREEFLSWLNEATETYYLHLDNPFYTAHILGYRPQTFTTISASEDVDYKYYRAIGDGVERLNLDYFDYYNGYTIRHHADAYATWDAYWAFFSGLMFQVPCQRRLVKLQKTWSVHIAHEERPFPQTQPKPLLE